MVAVKRRFDQPSRQSTVLQSREKYIDDLLNLPAALQSYIPKQLLKNVNIEECFDQNELEYVQNVLDNSNDNLRMYGSAESLLQNLKIYMKVPLRRKMFPLEMRSYYNAIPNFYHTLKKEVLYCKQDLLFYLQSCVYAELELHDDEHKVGYDELIDYMKNHEKRLSGCYEFVKYDHYVFEDIRKPFIRSRSLYVFPRNPKNAVVTGNPRSYEEKNFVNVFDNLISKYPCFFLPNSETKDRNATAVVRIFDNGGFKFVMESELFVAINLKNPDQKPLECMDVEGHYRTIEYKHVLERYCEKITEIDFIYYLIPSGLHAATPIVAPTGDHCIQAVGAQMEIITETILAGFFQKITQNTCHMIPKFIAILEKYFPSNILEELWKPIEDKPMKSVRNVGPQGFTVEDLKKELKYLGYTKIFPEITALARSAYTTIFLSLKPSELKTCELFAAIQGALTLVLIKRYPCLNKFVYRQKVCLHSRTKPCDFCLKAIKEAEAIVEAEIKAESEQPISTVTATTSGDVEKIEDTEESEPESMTSQAPVPMSNSKELQIFVALSPGETKAKSNSAILDSEVPENCQVLTESTSERCLRLQVHEEKSKESVGMEKKIKDLEKELEEWKKMHSKVFEENIALVSQVMKKDKQLNLAQKALEENEQKFKELEKTVKKQEKEASKVAKSVKQEKEDLKAKVNGLLSQLVEKDEKIYKLKKENLDDHKKFESFFLEMESRLNAMLEKQEEHTKEIEQLKRNAFTSDDELKKLTAKIAEKEAAENLLKRSNKGLLEKLRKSESNLQEITNRRVHLEAEVTEKNRVILELQKSIEKLEKSKKEHEARILKIRGVLDEVSPPEPIPEEKPDTECLICLLEMKPDQKTLKCDHCRKTMHHKFFFATKKLNAKNELSKKDQVIRNLKASNCQQTSNNASAIKELQKTISTMAEHHEEQTKTFKSLLSRISTMSLPVPSESSENAKIEKLKNLFNAPGPIELAKEMVEKLISFSNRSEIHQMARYEFQQYQGKIEKYLRELDQKTEKISEFPSFSDRFMSEYWKEIDRNDQKFGNSLSDSECFICFSEMKLDDEPTLKCEHCRKIVHFECASKWLKIHRSCAHCRREMLDPNEFPSLL